MTDSGGVSDAAETSSESLTGTGVFSAIGKTGGPVEELAVAPSSDGLLGLVLESPIGEFSSTLHFLESTGMSMLVSNLDRFTAGNTGEGGSTLSGTRAGITGTGAISDGAEAEALAAAGALLEAEAGAWAVATGPLTGATRGDRVRSRPGDSQSTTMGSLSGKCTTTGELGIGIIMGA